MKQVQYWLAELDMHGNPKLVDGAHEDRAGAVEARRLYRKLHSEGFLGHKIGEEPKHGFAVARVELERIP